MTFKKGDRVVSFRASQGRRMHYAWPDQKMFSGEVFRMDTNRYGEPVVHIIRDDRLPGGGDEIEVDGKAYRCYLFYEDDLELVTRVRRVPAVDAHIAGLSPESVDWEAHKAFMRNLK